MPLIKRVWKGNQEQVQKEKVPGKKSCHRGQEKNMFQRRGSK